MAKQICCKAAPEIELIVEGGDSVLLRFDINAIIVLQNLEGGLGTVLQKNIPELVASLVYAGAHSVNENYTLEDARKLVSGMCIGDLTTIVNEFTEALGIDNINVDEEVTKNLIAQLLKNA